jgi:hypothetical protein
MASWAPRASGEDEAQTTKTGQEMRWDDQRCWLSCAVPGDALGRWT